MQKKLLNFVRQIQRNERFDSLDEAAIKQGIVLKILSYLNWDPFNTDEIHPEYQVNGGKIDFSLRHGNNNKVFIVVKKGIQALKRLEEPLTNQARREAVSMAVLTNGITWWFYLPNMNGNLEDKRFHAMDISGQKDGQIAQKFVDFLLKQNVASGKAEEAAKTICQTKLKTLLIKENLPMAWNRLLSEPEKWIHEILANITKDLCGHKPNREVVEEFLVLEREVRAEISNIFTPNAQSSTRVGRRIGEKTDNNKDYSGKSIKAFTFNGIRFEVRSWRAFLLTICELISKKHKSDFEMVLTLAGKNKAYFSAHPYELLNSEKIKGSEIYVDLDLSAMGTVSLALRVLKLFGYGDRDLSIQTN